MIARAQELPQLVYELNSQAGEHKDSASLLPIKA
jgi:hypothetical protein